MIKAVTFDLWDTMVHDDSDEPKRAARGLRSKREERRHLLWQALQESNTKFAAFVNDTLQKPELDHADLPSYLIK